MSGERSEIRLDIIPMSDKIRAFPPMAAVSVPPLLKTLWNEFGFDPNQEQRQAILYNGGPLFLPAGPGSGKTRVLLWRTVNLIAVQGVAPECIFLSTFTEKAALQLRNGLRALLGAVSQKTLQPYDTAKLYVGTVHSLCQRLLVDRRISIGGRRTRSPIMLDELAQFLFLRRSKHWQTVLDASRGALSVTKIIQLFGRRGTSRLEAVAQLVMLFNRLSEEMIDPAAARNRTNDRTMRALLNSYGAYLELLRNQRGSSIHGPFAHSADYGHASSVQSWRGQSLQACNYRRIPRHESRTGGDFFSARAGEQEHLHRWR